MIWYEQSPFSSVKNPLNWRLGAWPPCPLSPFWRSLAPEYIAKLLTSLPGDVCDRRSSATESFKEQDARLVIWCLPLYCIELTANLTETLAFDYFFQKTFVGFFNSVSPVTVGFFILYCIVLCFTVLYIPVA